MLPLRRLPFVFGAATAALAALPAQTPSAGATPPPESRSSPVAKPLPDWIHTGTLRTSVGWRDNLLLSPFAPIGRSFARGEVEAFLWRQPRDHWEAIALLNGDVLRYFSPPPETGGEQQWFAHVEMRWLPSDRWRVSLKGDAYLQDVVVDLSETAVVRVVAPTRAAGAFATGAVRVKLPGGFTLEPSAQAKRSDYRDYPGDYGELKVGARVEWKRSERLAWSGGWFEHRRRYLQRPQFTAGGRELAGTHLRFAQREGDARVSSAWTAGGRWSAAITAARLENRDGASGYFDYDQNRARVELGWERNGWKAAIDGEAKRLAYRVQTVGAGIAPPPRIAEDFQSTLRIERPFGAGWTSFAEHRWERSRSNEEGFSYRANTALAGVERTF